MTKEKSAYLHEALAQAKAYYANLLQVRPVETLQIPDEPLCDGFVPPREHILNGIRSDVLVYVQIIDDVEKL